MELQYYITAEDYIAFQDHFVKNNPQAKRTFIRARIQGALFILAAGMFIAYLKKAATLPMVLLLGVCAILYFLFIPKYLLHNMHIRVRKMLKTSSKTALGNKTLTLEQDEIHLTGSGEDSTYAYSSVTQVYKDTHHYFLYVGPMEALLVPFTAFTSQQIQDDFYQTLCKKIDACKGSNEPT